MFSNDYSIYKMFLKSISYLSIFWIFDTLDKSSTLGEHCFSVKGKAFQRKHDQITCGKSKSIYIEQLWVNRQPDCVNNQSRTSFLKDKKNISCRSSSYCHVEYLKSNRPKGDRYLHIRFQCTDCIAIHGNKEETITCPASSVIEFFKVRFGAMKCPAIKYYIQNAADDSCRDRHTCRPKNQDQRTVSVYFQCGDDNNIKDNDIATESHGGNYIPEDDSSTESYGSYEIPVDEASMENHDDSNNQDDSISTESYDRSSKLGEDTNTEYPDCSRISDKQWNTEHYGGPNYAVIVGGIVGGVLLIICISVGVFLLRRCNCTESSKEHIITSLNPSYDPTHVLVEADTNQQGHLMNSADTSYVSTSHEIHIDNTTNEESNTYSHIRNAVDDSDVMYDHTIRHTVHDNCDGDYGIAQRRITEDDYDVSGNYRRSTSKEADTVYN
ncbi:uncharacterized protein LOC134717873 [Mytilus trossulus]|uniref:uncharacterized protein LOC134717873 n=1 Tax=Mytilus trossulus TaxID=6551 RepID=UPI0030056862